ncbi:carboxypeptidase-like regulatory domain-containing protein [Archangium sp.]|uniref:carboxypeptidase-like regulatory domain-containing protein n=1 Tax=Archangium sp. TaxID=1872627 RepID=UPI002D58EA02|nr:carboxypeptidase-like regulatory domain-containing protein [Archangium sp.]HYO52225.1 carboxypeptidase-like regulatory domain-containing protein [Archangium sp.]
MKSSIGKRWQAGLLLACTSWLTLACGSTGSQLEELPPSQESGALANCASVAGSITVCGTALDSNGFVLAGITAELGGRRVLTGADGSFSISAPAGALLTFTLSAPGFMPFSTNISSDILGRSFALARLFQQTFDQLGPVMVLDPQSGAGARIDLTQLVDMAGNPATPPITIGVRYLDPSRVSMPGDDGAITLQGQNAFLESYGVTYVEALGPQNQKLKLRAGTKAQIFIPITNARLPVAPPSIALWTQQPGSGQWVEQQAPAQQQPSPMPRRECGPTGGEGNLSCNPEDCANISPNSFVGPVDSLGYVNADIAKTDPACLHIKVDVTQLPPGTQLPICLDIKIPVPGGSVQTRQVCAGAAGAVLYNIPANVNLTISQAGGLGCPTPPSTNVQVNSGAPWGGTGRPSNPSQCNSVLNIPPLP